VSFKILLFKHLIINPCKTPDGAPLSVAAVRRATQRTNPQQGEHSPHIETISTMATDATSQSTTRALEADYSAELAAYATAARRLHQVGAKQTTSEKSIQSSAL
jgi:hypothetical protein